MQLSWRTIAPGSNVSVALHHRVIRSSRILNVRPSFQILSFFSLIPQHEVSENGSFRDRFHKISAWRALFIFAILGFLALLLVHDVLYFCLDKAFWSNYMKSDNRIVMLLVSVRYILIFLKNCSAVFFFAIKSQKMGIYLNRMNALVVKLHITRKQEKLNRILFVVLYLIPFVLIGFRIIISALLIAQSSLAYRKIPFGLLQAPIWARYTFYFFAEFLGGILANAVYIQISAYSRVLSFFCKLFNNQISMLRVSLDDCDGRKKGHQVNRALFLNDVQMLRCLHEEIIAVYKDHEQLFSFQILIGILTNACILFSTLASFFTPALSTEAFFVYTLSVLGFLYVMFLLPLFPIQLSEESGSTLDLLQNLIYKRHMVKTDQLSSGPNPTDAMDTMEMVSLAAFLQRVYTRPLTLSAGGFMDLTRSFVISVGAVIVGFTIFLMERVEKQTDALGSDAACRNNSRSFIRPVRESRPVII